MRRRTPVRRRLLWPPLCLAWVGLGAALATPGAGQEALSIASAGRTVASVPIERDRGFAAVPLDALARADWRIRTGDGVAVLESGRGERLEVVAGSPFVLWGEERRPVQLADVPYLAGDRLLVPLQLLTDVLPDRLPDRYDAPRHAELRLLAPGEAAARPDRAGPAAAPAAPTERFVVVIDPGHGGEDPGAIGPGGAREKDVALGFARALAEELGRRPDVDVHLTRDRDVLVPLWKRGEDATRLKGDRPGIFISIHANALPRRSVRGVETYFLSDARTEHERRVAALENASLQLESGDGGGWGSDLEFIMSELRNHDYLHWSAELAELVQESLASVHPGPDRGVKQGPFAVITNALMPAVLVEIGFITHPAEERVLNDALFQRRAAEALAEAVGAFFERYPPRGGAAVRDGG